MKFFLYLFSLITISTSNFFANNNDFNSDSSIEIVETPAYNPEFGLMLEGAYNYIFFNPNFRIYKDKITEPYGGYGSGSYYLWKNTQLTDHQRNQVLKKIEWEITNYFYSDSKSINGSVTRINKINEYRGKTERTEVLKANYCLSLRLVVNTDAAQVLLSNKGRNLTINNLDIQATNCNGVVKTLSIPTISMNRSGKRDTFSSSEYGAAVWSALDKVIKPMNLDPKYYYSKYTPKKERSYVKINGKVLNSDKVIAEEEIKNYLKNRSSSLEGIYHKKTSSSTSPGYKVAVLKITNSFAPWSDKDNSKQKYVGVFLSGGFEGNETWKIGDIKLYFRPTIKDNYYETWYYMADKSVASSAAITFGYMTEKNSKGSYTYWTTDSPSSKYLQGANISINKEDNSKWYSDDYWERTYPYKSKPSAASKPKSKPKSSTPSGKKTQPQKGIKIG